jgi:transketolase
MTEAPPVPPSPAGAAAPDLPALMAAAHRIRQRVVRMAEGKGEGYVGQGLQAADLLAVLFCAELRLAGSGTRHLPDQEGDRFILSTGHYSIALWAAFAEIGLLDDAELASYGADGHRIAMSTIDGAVPGVELTGGSLGHGPGVAAGLALGLRMRGEPGRVFCYLSDGELQEGAVWEAAMFAGDRGLDNLWLVVDINRTQADGALVVEVEPVADKFRAFGWACAEADGHDIGALLRRLDGLRGAAGPRALICSTEIGHGVPLITGRDRAHFVRVDDDEWARVRNELEEAAP